MIRRLFWLLLAFSLAGTVASALVLLAGPTPEVAAWAGWSFLGLSLIRWQWLHYGLGLLLAVSGTGCLVLSGRRVMAASDDQAGPGPVWAVAAAVFAVVVLAGLLGLPPAGTLAGMSERLKDWHAKSFGEPPMPGAAALTPTDLAKRLGLDPDKALASLATHNVKIASPKATVAQVAKDNGLVPAAVYETLRGGKDVAQPVQAETPKTQTPPPPPALPADPPPGLGRLKLVDICEQYGLNLKASVDTLAKANIRASGDMTLRQIAQSNLILPIEVYDALRGQSPAQPQPPVAQPQAPTAQPPAVPPQVQAHETPVVQPQPASPQAPAPQVQAPPASQPQGIEPPPGLARMTLAAFCKEYGLEQGPALGKLKSKGIVAFSDMTFREIAVENALTPEQVLEIISR